MMQLHQLLERSSIDMSIAFRGFPVWSNKGQTDDYINCPLTKDEFTEFVNELISAERIPLNIEKPILILV